MSAEYSEGNWMSYNRMCRYEQIRGPEWAARFRAGDKIAHAEYAAWSKKVQEDTAKAAAIALYQGTYPT